MQQSAAKTVCTVCKLHPSKYKCPRCSVQTCSLGCVLSHKQQTGCSGKKEAVPFIAVKEYTDKKFHRDYHLLESMAQASDAARRDIRQYGTQIGASRQRGRKKQPETSKWNESLQMDGLQNSPKLPTLPRPLYRLVMAARQRGIDLRLMPKGMVKRDTNTTRLCSSRSLCGILPSRGSVLAHRVANGNRPSPGTSVVVSPAYAAGRLAYGLVGTQPTGVSESDQKRRQPSSIAPHSQSEAIDRSRASRRRSNRKRRRIEVETRTVASTVTPQSGEELRAENEIEDPRESKKSRVGQLESQPGRLVGPKDTAADQQSAGPKDTAADQQSAGPKDTAADQQSAGPKDTAADQQSAGPKDTAAVRQTLESGTSSQAAGQVICWKVEIIVRFALSETRGAPSKGTPSHGMAQVSSIRVVEDLVHENCTLLDLLAVWEEEVHHPRYAALRPIWKRGRAHEARETSTQASSTRGPTIDRVSSAREGTCSTNGPSGHDGPPAASKRPQFVALVQRPFRYKGSTQFVAFPSPSIPLRSMLQHEAVLEHPTVHLVCLPPGDDPHGAIDAATSAASGMSMPPSQTNASAMDAPELAGTSRAVLTGTIDTLVQQLVQRCAGPATAVARGT